MTPLLFGAFGLIIGSFLNVLILREGKRSLGGRSLCPSCGTLIRWYDLIPVLSWVVLRGRCRDCATAISLQYPLVELGTAILFALVGGAPVEFFVKLMALPVAALLFAIAVYDFRTTIIPDRWSATSSILALLATLVLSFMAGLPLMPALLAGPIAALPLFLLWFVSSGRWMGLGDAKLTLSIGWLLGITEGLIAVLFAFILGALVTVPLLALSSETGRNFVRRLIPTVPFLGERFRLTMKSEVPFGPFLVASCFLVWFASLYAIPLPI